MATLSEASRITHHVVAEEIARLNRLWYRPDLMVTPDVLTEYLTSEQIQQMDLFDSIQLTSIINICRNSKSISDAGRKLFAASRRIKQNPNDADRLKKYLAKFGLTWKKIII